MELELGESVHVTTLLRILKTSLQLSFSKKAVASSFLTLNLLWGKTWVKRTGLMGSYAGLSLTLIGP